MQPVRDRSRALFSPARSTVQLFMWQLDTVGLASYIMDVALSLVPCLVRLLMRPRRLDRCKIPSFLTICMNRLPSLPHVLPCRGFPG